MSSVNEAIVREYFEALGYFVTQPGNHPAPGRFQRSGPEADIDLLILHPLVAEPRIPTHMFWTTDDFGGVARALVSISGKHTGRLYKSTIDATPDLLRFAESAARRAAAERTGAGATAAVLCLPQLPAAGDLREKALHALRDHGVDGVVSFHTMLADLIGRVDVGHNYEQSDVLQTIRILKTYGFLRGSQMELFAKPSIDQRRRKRATKMPSSPPVLEIDPGR